MVSNEAIHPNVIISYSYDSPEHDSRVLELSDHLRADGIDCILDQYEVSPPEGWSRWMDRQIRDADFVLMICTPTYYRRVMGEEELSTGLGLRWERNLIYRHLFKIGTVNTRLIPVLLGSASVSDIPLPLQGTKYYRLTSEGGYEDLYRRLINEPLKIKSFTEVISPYIFTKPMRGEGLIGRDDLFRQITKLWSGSYDRSLLLIYGHRRMGKTSLAQAIQSRCQFGPDTMLVYHSLDSSVKHERFLYYILAEKLWLYVQDRMREPNMKQFTRVHARVAFTRFLTKFHQVAKEKQVILVLDEFELLHKAMGIPATYEAIEYLRQLTRDLGFDWLTLALVGLNDLDDLEDSYGNALLGWTAIHVSFLTPAQVATVLANPPNDPDFPLNYTSEALTMIATLTNGQPYLVQIIGDLLVQHYNYIVFTQQREHSGVFDVADVEAVIDDVKFYATAASYFQGVWAQVLRGQPEELVLLKTLAQYEGGMEDSALQNEVHLDERVLIESISVLKRHDILSSKENLIRYAVPLMRFWVKNILLRDTPPHLLREEGRND